MKTIHIALSSLLALAGICLGQNPETKIIQLESLKINPGLVTDEIAKRFDPAADARDLAVLRGQVEQRIKSMFASSLSQGLSASKLVQLAVRGDSLQTLQKEWKVASELGAGGEAPNIGINTADYIANATIQNIVAERQVFGNELAAIWKNEITASLEITSVDPSGGKKVITETVSASGKGRKGAGGKAPDFNAAQIRGMLDELSKKFAVRILDNYSSVKVVAIRRNMMIIDRGLAAGVAKGDKFKVIETVDANLGTDAGFPLGEATVTFVNEDTSTLEFDPALIEGVKQENLTLKPVR